MGLYYELRLWLHTISISRWQKSSHIYAHSWICYVIVGGAGGGGGGGGVVVAVVVAHLFVDYNITFLGI